MISKKGFTLIEILVALLVASLISIMSFQFLSNSVFLKDRVNESMNNDSNHMNAINIIRLDLLQAVPFIMKDTNGRDLNMSFIGNLDGSIKFGIIYLSILAFILWFISFYLYKKGYKIKS